MSSIDWGKKLEDCGALWRMNYEAEGAHAELTSGKHSDGYMNCAKIVIDPNLAAEVAGGIIENLRSQPDWEEPDFVVGPAYGAITFAHEVARQLGVNFGFTEVEYTDEGKMQVLKRFDIPADAKVLVIEDITTTGGSALKTINILKEGGHNVLPMIGIILNWSGESEIEGNKIVSLIEAKMNIYEPAECELCKEGRKAVRPKSNWGELAR